MSDRTIPLAVQRIHKTETKPRDYRFNRNQQNTETLNSKKCYYLSGHRCPCISNTVRTAANRASLTDQHQSTGNHPPTTQNRLFIREVWKSGRVHLCNINEESIYRAGGRCAHMLRLTLRGRVLH
jgi:hypothetical protein